MIQFMGGANQRMIKYNSAGAMIGRKSQGIQILKLFHAWEGFAPPSP